MRRIIYCAVAMLALSPLALFAAATQKKIPSHTDEQCALQAGDAFKANGWDKKPLASFLSHYNPKLKNCFIIVTSTENGVVTKALGGVSDHKSYARYAWKEEKGKDYWTVVPFVCVVTLPSGKEQECHTSQEFDKLLLYYMH